MPPNEQDRPRRTGPVDTITITPTATTPKERLGW
jgi:hypothetical protein